MQITGWPTTVIQRGQVIVEDNQLKAERGAGEFVPRKRIDCTGMPGRLAPELDTQKNFGVDLGL
jgi:dihydropyrimidinase